MAMNGLAKVKDSNFAHPLAPFPLLNSNELRFISRKIKGKVRKGKDPKENPWVTRRNKVEKEQSIE